MTLVVGKEVPAGGCVVPAAGAALPTSDTISWVGSRARPSLDFPLGCRLPCRSQAATLPRLPMPKAPGPAGGPATLHEGPPGGQDRGVSGSRVGGQGGLSGCCATRVPPLPPSPVQGWLAAVWGSLERTKTSTVETQICDQNNFFFKETGQRAFSCVSNNRTEE